MEPGGQHRVVTPEAVALRLDVAGLGSRMIAALIDAVIQTGILLAFGLGAFTALELDLPRPVVIVIGVTALIVVFGYFPAFEAAWGGRTPGKRALRIRVVQTDGQPVGLGAALVRNLVRIVDFLPLGYSLGALAILATRRSQRLGDLAAGTIVVRERPLPRPAPVALSSAGGALDVAGLSERDYATVRSFLERRESFQPRARAELAQRLAGALRPRVGGPGEGDQLSSHDEAFLEQVAAAFRSRWVHYS